MILIEPGYKIRASVNRQVVARNKKWNENKPPISVYAKGKIFHVHEVTFFGTVRLLYRPMNPLHCGARVFIETTGGASIEEA